MKTFILKAQILDLASQILLACNDNYLTSQIINLNFDEMDEKQNVFLEYFYIKCQMIRLDNNILSLNSLNDFIDKSLNLSKSIDTDFRTEFLSIFASTIFDLNRKQRQNKDTNLKNACLNWFIEFMGMIKSLLIEDNGNDVGFAFEIFFVFIYCLSSCDDETIEQTKIVSINLNCILDNLRNHLNKLMRKPHWKQISKIFIDWLMFVLSKLDVIHADKMIVTSVKNCLNEMFLFMEDFDISNETRYKYLNIMNKQLK